MIKSAICEMLGIEYPVFQVAKSITSNPIGVNIMLLSPFVDEVAKVVIEEKVEVVTTGAGNPSKYIKDWLAAGIKVIPVVASVAMAKLMTRLGASVLIAEGGESGGHVGELTTMVLVPQICDATTLPVIAAGGIADGRGAATAFMLGACGVQMGTRFLSAEECSIHPTYKEKILKATDLCTMVTGKRLGHPVRSLRTQFARDYSKAEYGCCRETKETANSVAAREENNQLKEKMRDLVTQFSDGIAAFEVTAEGLVKPLYATRNVCNFFGYTEEEWLPLTERFTPLEIFVAYSEVDYENFAELLRTGEAEFTYFDHQSETERKIIAICSEKEPNANSLRYVMLYPVESSSETIKQTLLEKRTVSIRTFGYFDVFVGDTPIAFRNKKSKELFALLVDRKGGYVTSEEAISFLWEDEPANTLTLSRYRKVALRLKSTLEEYGISDIVEAVDGKRRIVMDKVECDLYNYLSGKEEYSQLFKGSYLINYSWGETTLGELINYQK